MEKQPNISDGQKTSEAEAISAILLTIGDTTWRMFVPSIGFTLLGVWLDGVFGLKPWLMVAGIVVGCLSAVLLVKFQIDTIKKRKEAKR